MTEESEKWVLWWIGLISAESLCEALTVSVKQVLLVVVAFQPHKYIVQAEVLRQSWPISESSWTFVNMLKDLEKNELKGVLFLLLIFIKKRKRKKKFG